MELIALTLREISHARGAAPEEPAIIDEVARIAR
jgi:hypothetical protein